MSPDVAESIRKSVACVCGAQRGEHCVTPAGAPMPWIHQARVYRDLFKPKNSGPDTPSPVAGPVAASTTGSTTSTPTENREIA